MGAGLEGWEKIVLGILFVGIILWLFPSTKNMLENSKNAPKDWMGLAVPIIAVVLFIMLLISSV